MNTVVRWMLEEDKLFVIVRIKRKVLLAFCSLISGSNTSWSLQ